MALYDKVEKNKKDEGDKPKRGFDNIAKTVSNWVDTNVLPVVALVALAGLAVRGLSEYLPDMSDTTTLTVSIAAVAFLLFKSKAEK